MPMSIAALENPYRPGAGHTPPYLAGRDGDKEEFERLLKQTTILENLVLTGLRGVGKTVLLDTFKPIAIRKGWLWVGTDFSESVSVSEQTMATRLLTDLSVVTSSMVLSRKAAVGFAGATREKKLDYKALSSIYAATPGLAVDKTKAVLEAVAAAVEHEGKRGIVFAYDEAQNLADSAEADQFPLSLLLDLFQSIQRKGIPFMLVLTGLPTLFPKLVEARTYAERMFRVVTLTKLNRDDSRDAIIKPVRKATTLGFSDESVETICDESGGYPYFIQFICREAFDAFIQQLESGEHVSVPVDAITRKLDTDFFTGRWSRATDRQRDLLFVIATLHTADEEFTVSEIVTQSKEVLEKSFTASHVSQMLSALSDAGLIFKNRWGKYSFAVPLFDRFILRQEDDEDAA
jgi:type II secretory pathway predicted ATPase ExeA